MTVQRDSVRDQIRRVITERILSGAYRPGDRLVELQLAREFGASQGPVREALRELETSRLVESLPYRGTRVRIISRNEICEAYRARGVLEQAAAPSAAQALKGDVDELMKEYQAILRAAKARDLAGLAERNFAFHRAIVEASANTVLLRLWDSLSFETVTRVRLNQAGGVHMHHAKAHLPIVEALKRGEGELAGTLLRQHAEELAVTLGEPPAD